MAKKTYRGFWAHLLRVKDAQPHAAWTLSFHTPVAGKPALIVEHEFNHRLTRRGFERKVLEAFRTHCPGGIPDGLAIHHVTARRWNKEKGKFVTATNGRGLPGRSNVILVGVPAEALDALRSLGGKRPERIEILKHVPPV